MSVQQYADYTTTGATGACNVHPNRAWQAPLPTAVQHACYISVALMPKRLPESLPWVGTWAVSLWTPSVPDLSGGALRV
eukprot:CAMPEP_0202911112 /NCGR_PEP_ID=MMETSP1392-20130828/54082_1 /ASSEMBLY_ACC=CAM_ASM_000868 /TAXON_ID=225041 /ORGANISM="Chlamydomonas chlamydogama, Strain SAG 11-48b" /LENGTH=78 /DNA_ID=CAMNT_0049601499 /DNA_START=227 /DNA_END=463 /DNA_ORIENTATION=+